MTKKKKSGKKKMPSAPIKPDVGNVKGIGKQGQVLGGVSFMTKSPGGPKANQAIIRSILKIN